MADLLVLDADSVDIADRVHDDILDSFIYFLVTIIWFREVWSAGRHVVSEGRHFRRSEITQRYLETIDCLDMSY